LVFNIESKTQLAKDFAKKRHHGQLRKDGTTSFYEHLESVVGRLQQIGVTDEDTLSAAWLHDILESTNTTLDEIDKTFGKKVASLVLSLTKDNSLPKKSREKQYISQLKDSSFDAKLIKLCDIASNLNQVHNSELDEHTKIKTIKKITRYAQTLRAETLNFQDNTNLVKIIDEINEIAAKYDQRQLGTKIN
jgi:(p)ppGpp synthase/HD superfamily hydrolase